MVEQHLAVICITYNVNGRNGTKELVDRMLSDLQLDSDDMIVIGIQELPHSDVFGASKPDYAWFNILCNWMKERRKSLMTQTWMASNLLLIFARLDIFRLVDRIDSRNRKKSFGGYVGYKGTISIRILFKSQVNLIFLSSHFLAKPENYISRCEQYKSSLYCTFEDEVSKSSGNQYVFWFGDFNFRVEDVTALDVVRQISRVSSIANYGVNKIIQTILNNNDQFNKAQRSGQAFSDFAEAQINFLPTYRLKVGSDQYDSLRVPSWCDRIVYKSSSVVHCKFYESYRSIMISDHFPVIAKFSLPQALCEDSSQWNVSFYPMSKWIGAIPFSCGFTFSNNFWDRSGSYRDWIGVYPYDFHNYLSPIEWLYLITCKSSEMGGTTSFDADFPVLQVGLYRLAYFSVKKNSIQGVSDPFEIIPLE